MHRSVPGLVRRNSAHRTRRPGGRFTQPPLRSRRPVLKSRGRVWRVSAALRGPDAATWHEPHASGRWCRRGPWRPRRAAGRAASRPPVPPPVTLAGRPECHLVPAAPEPRPSPGEPPRDHATHVSVRTAVRRPHAPSRRPREQAGACVLPRAGARCPRLRPSREGQEQSVPLVGSLHAPPGRLPRPGLTQPGHPTEAPPRSCSRGHWPRTLSLALRCQIRDLAGAAVGPTTFPGDPGPCLGESGRGGGFLWAQRPER